MSKNLDPKYAQFERWASTPNTLPEIKTPDAAGMLAMIKEALWLAYQQGFRDATQETRSELSAGEAQGS